MQKNKILVIGASGQVGTELIARLREINGNNNVIASDLKIPDYEVMEGGSFEILDVLDRSHLIEIIQKYKIDQVYLLAALLSATAEKNPSFAWKLNIDGLLNVLELARQKIISRIFWPSSIAVFGATTPKENAPQFTITEPNTIYGISKLAGERWCDYYNMTYDVDVRSVRYPGLMGYKSNPGGGTTDYTVHIFYGAIKNRSYNCFLRKDAVLPMMYMADAIRATVEIMQVSPDKISIRSSYNISAMSFSPDELASEIKKHIPEFQCTFKPDERQKYAENWPNSIDDKYARKDWGWKHSYDLERMTKDMLANLQRYHGF